MLWARENSEIDGWFLLRTGVILPVCWYARSARSQTASEVPFQKFRFIGSSWGCNRWYAGAQNQFGDIKRVCGRMTSGALDLRSRSRAAIIFAPGVTGSSCEDERVRDAAWDIHPKWRRSSERLGSMPGSRRTELAAAENRAWRAAGASDYGLVTVGRLQTTSAGIPDRAETVASIIYCSK